MVPLNPEASGDNTVKAVDYLVNAIVTAVKERLGLNRSPSFFNTTELTAKKLK